MDLLTYTPIPPEVLARLPEVLAKHSDAFDVQVLAVVRPPCRGVAKPDAAEDGYQAFSIVLYRDPKQVIPGDRRKNAYVTAEQISYDYRPDGTPIDEKPAFFVARYRG